MQETGWAWSPATDVRHVYTSLLYLLLPIILFRLLVRGFKNRGYWRRWGERFGYVVLDGPVPIWLHAVSVGEVRAAAPLVNYYLDNSDLGIVVTTMTPTGSDEVARLFGNRVKHCYAPYDYPGSVRRFLKNAGPKVAMIMETEIWPNLILGCKRSGIPVVFANLRLSERSFRRYQKVQNAIGQVLEKVSCFAVQSAPDAERLQALGARPSSVHVTGSIKFDVRIPASLHEVALVLRREWGQERPVWIAGSTHEGEEETVLSAYGKLKREYEDLVLVLVPRHPERFSAVTKLARRSRFSVALRSEPRRDLGGVDVYVGDTMGELTLLYAASDIAFVGGSLVPHGGHNVLEPCALGVPVIFGPHMFNFLEISRLALETGAGIEVEGEQDLVSAVRMYLSDPNLRFKAGEAGRRLVEENKGALDETVALFRDYVEPPGPVFL